MSQLLVHCDLISARGVLPCGALSSAKTITTKTKTRC